MEFGTAERDRLQRLYRELTEGAPQGRLLVTCRPANTNLPGIRELALGGLARPDSLNLLAAVTGLKDISTDRTGYERLEIDALLDSLDDHPLSIQLVAPHLKTLTPARIRDEFGPLLDRFADETVDEPRDRSLLASMEFSKARLSDDAQKMLPYLDWFEGGVFEQFLLDFAEMEPQIWEPLKAELEATALVSIEEGIQISGRPYLRFHPTLRYAAAPEQVPDFVAAEQRFTKVYMSVAASASQALHGSQPALWMGLLVREEANLQAAIYRAIQCGNHEVGGWIAGVLGDYLGRAGRLRERDTLVAWVRAKLPEDGELDAVICGSIRQHAWSILTLGHAAEAVQEVKSLIARLESEGIGGGADVTHELALALDQLGRSYVHTGRPDLALAPLKKAIADLEKLDERGSANLAAALGDLANAYHHLGELDSALASAERGLALRRDLGNQRNIVAALGRIAQILAAQERYFEADSRFTEANRAGQAVGDLGLQGLMLQHQGSLQGDMGNQVRCIELYKQAISLFQRAADRGEEMRTYNLLGVAEESLDAAEAWYVRSRELAVEMDDHHQQAAVAHNLGVLHQTRAEQEPDSDKQDALIRRAVASVEESLAIKLEMENQVGAASSYFQLGILHLIMGTLRLAEENAQKSMEIYESRNLPDVYKAYASLAEIARRRGDQVAAGQWQAKHDAKLAELERLRRGDIPAGESGEESDQLLQAISALVQAAGAARASNESMAPDAAEALATLAGAPPPYDTVGRFLQAVGSGQPVPPVPAGLSPHVATILENLVGELNG